MNRLLTTVLALWTCTFAGSVSAQDGRTNEWQHSYSAFLERLAKIVGKDPVWPTEGRFGVLAASNDKGEKIWLIPQHYPISHDAVAVAGQPTTIEFKGKTVTWDLVVEAVRDFPAITNVVIDFKKRDLTAIHPKFSEFVSFASTVASSHKEAARKLRPGQSIRVDAKIDWDILQSVDVFFGIGPNSSKIGVSVLLKDAKFEVVKTP